MPPPKLAIRLPDSSNLLIGSALVPRHPGVIGPEQRSADHTDRPSRSTATPLVPPKGRPSGPSPQLRMTRYGLAPLLTGGVSCVKTALPCSATHAAAGAAIQTFARRDADLSVLLSTRPIWLLKRGTARLPRKPTVAHTTRYAAGAAGPPLALRAGATSGGGPPESDWGGVC